MSTATEASDLKHLASLWQKRLHDAPLTVLGAVAAAGGPLFPANTSSVRILRSGKRGGSIQIGFKDAAELRRLVELLRSLG
jgi:hypothetical protein